MALQLQDDREQFYSRLSSTHIVSPNQEWLACMVASWCAGQGVLPDYLGLESDQFKQLKNSYFQDCALPEQAVSGSRLDFSRMLEKEVLRVSGKISKEEMEKMIVDDLPSPWRLACQMIVRDEDILVEY